MADKGFDISYELFVRGCKLNIPPFVRGGRLSKTDVTKTHKIASLRIHVERAIGCIKQYHILSSVIPLNKEVGVKYCNTRKFPTRDRLRTAGI